MITPALLTAVLDTMVEKIPLCAELVARGECAWDCCQYTDSYCLLLPGEMESALSLGYTFDQYDVIDPEYFGGAKMVPRSRGCCVDPALGEWAYKSLDCRVFPYWFQLEGDRLVLTQGRSCPIVLKGLPLDAHREQTARVASLLSDDPDVVDFLRAARMINYELVPDTAPVRRVIAGSPTRNHAPSA